MKWVPLQILLNFFNYYLLHTYLEIGSFLLNREVFHDCHHLQTQHLQQKALLLTLWKATKERSTEWLNPTEERVTLMSTFKQTELKYSLVSFFHFHGKFTGSDIDPIHQRGEKLTIKGIV